MVRAMALNSSREQARAEDAKSESLSDVNHQTFKILANSEEMGAVMSQAGEVSRIASDRLLNESCPSDVDSQSMPDDDSIEMHSLTRLTSEATISPLYRPIGDGSLRQPKAARDVVFLALFLVHAVVAFLAPAALFAAADRRFADGLTAWIPKKRSLLVVSPLCATTLAALFAVCLVISEPREVRVAVATLAYPISLCGLVSLCAVIGVETLRDHDFVVVGAWSVIPLTSGVRAVASAMHLRGSEPFFDAMLEVVAKFFATARGPVIKLAYGSLAAQGLYLIAWIAVRSSIREIRCGTDSANATTTRPLTQTQTQSQTFMSIYIIVELLLIGSLYWTTQVVRSIVRAVVSGCAMHYLVRMGADSRPEAYSLDIQEHAASSSNGCAPLTGLPSRPEIDTEVEDDDDDHAAGVNDLLLAQDGPHTVTSNPILAKVGLAVLGTKRIGHPRKPQGKPRDDQRARAHRKELIAAARKVESFFINLSLTTSFGSVCRGALICPLAEFARGVIDLSAAWWLTRCLARRCLRRDSALSTFGNTNRELAFVHVTLHNKAFSSAAHDVSRVVNESGVSELLNADSVVPILHTYRAAMGTLLAALFSALTLLKHNGTAMDAIDCQDTNSLLLHFGIGFICFSLAVEPVVAALETFYLGFVQAPQGLARADPIVYRRFARILNRDHARAAPRGKPSNKRVEFRQEVSL